MVGLKDDFTRSFTVSRVIDGDTVAGSLSLGFGLYADWSVRLYGINARELHDPGGTEARDRLTRLLPPGTKCVVHSAKFDKYSKRVDAILVMPDGSKLNDRLVREGWAAPYDGTGKTADHVPAWPRPKETR